MGLWQRLADPDKQLVGHLDRPRPCRLRCPKAKDVLLPGVDRGKRGVLGGSAQRPDCCWLVEAIFVRLCKIHKSPKKKWGLTSLTRWCLILNDYRTIQQLVLSSEAMKQCSLQLTEVDQTTLRQIGRASCRERG